MRSDALQLAAKTLPSFRTTPWIVDEAADGLQRLRHHQYQQKNLQCHSRISGQA